MALISITALWPIAAKVVRLLYNIDIELDNSIALISEAKEIFIRFNLTTCTHKITISKTA